MFRTPKLQVISTCLNELQKSEFSIWETDDCGLALEKLEGITERLTPMLDPGKNDFTQTNCTWILLKHRNEVIGGIAARIDDLGQETLGEFWRRQARRMYKTELQYVNPLADNEVRGKVLYFGQLVLHKDYRGWGDHLRYFTVYCQMAASVASSPDWQYAFIPEAHAQIGLVYNHCFARSIPGAQEWAIETGGRVNSEVFVISSRGDLDAIARYYSKFPEKLRIVKNQGVTALSQNRRNGS